MEGNSANGLLSLVVVNTLVLAVFAFSFAKPRSRDWRSLGLLSAFIVALFTEMYGFPLTIYLLAGWLANHYPAADPFAYSAGQFWHTLFGLERGSRGNPVRLVSYVLTAGGFLLIAYAWRTLHEAQRNHQLARTGPYAYVWHPQYAGFMLVTFGLLLAWPALSTLIMFPVLVTVYIRLARIEEKPHWRSSVVTTAATWPSRPAFFLDLVGASRRTPDVSQLVTDRTHR